MACILLSVSAVSVQDSQAYRNTDMTWERISLIFELSGIFLSFQMVLSLASAVVAWAILAIISGLDPSSWYIYIYIYIYIYNIYIYIYIYIYTMNVMIFCIIPAKKKSDIIFLLVFR